ncbi:AMP-binding protein [Granulosicoccus antarcticus]|uniref:Long-chain-fatty-acid--CoA ligase n=1 Tax=Granulosicoccus antarcticus IMCC3135 TaxID=1192854 RepID=A0A2Z2NK06_9GAMM|nr:AMP-binding protein [Granulosicoccus antarcticus]ASJ70835.1 Long-chain-fatty-acid--CoA ligase [Granulosicoccus antarcticus IMCC3135]
MTSHIFASPLPAVSIPEVSITEFVLQQASRVPDRDAIIDGPSGKAYTFEQLRSKIHQLAGGLQSMGLKPGDVVGLIAPNCPDYAVVFHAIAVCGGTVTTINPAYAAEEITKQLENSNACLLISDISCLPVATEASKGSPCKELICMQEQEKLRYIDQLMGEEIEQVSVDVRQHPVVLPYSSGTTGMPKGVMLSHFNLVANIVQINAAVQYDTDEAGLAVLPFFHIYGMQVLMGSLLTAGATIVTMPRFDMEQTLQLIQKHRITQYFAVPPIILGLAKTPLLEKYDISSLRKIFSGAAPLGGELAETASQRVGCPVVQAYGMTEISPVSHITPGYDSRPGSSGVTVSNTLSRIVGEDGQDLGIDEEGELWVKGPQVMLGYLNNEEATRETIDENGWLRTGDVGRIDADGYMSIVDRVKELIKYKGFQVAPAELEAIIVTHPDVTDVAVIGIPDEEAGELPKAFVVLKSAADGGEPQTSADDIRNFVKPHVATYKQIHEVEFIDSIPKSASGKILRRFLRNS